MADLRGLRQLPGDLARWAFWVKLRDALDPERPQQLRAMFPLWRLQHAAAVGQRALMLDEYRRCFGSNYSDSEYRTLIEDAYRAAFRAHLSELLLGKLNPQTWPLYMRLEGQEHLDAALARGKGAVLLLPHAGNVMMLIAAISLSGYRYTQYAARGLAPKAVAEAHPEVFGHSRWREQARAAREANEDRLPATFLTLETPARELYRTLARNELVGIAFDGRIGSRFVPATWLGRTALLNPGPFRLAAATGAAIVPTFCACPDGAPDVARFGPPLDPTGASPEALMTRFLGEQAEPWVRAHPAEYGLWLAHCRARAAVDDHPFFIDYAPDDRWKRHLPRGGGAEPGAAG